MGYLHLSAGTLIFIHVIGIIAVFAVGYHMGSRKAELEQRQQQQQGRIRRRQA